MMKNLAYRLSQILLFLALGQALLTMYSCSTEEEHLTEEAIGTAYVPISIGKYWIYKTDSIIYNKASARWRDSSQCLIMEEVVDTFRDSQNKLIYAIDIFYRKDSLQGWELINTSFVDIDNLRYIKRENGLSFIKLDFPVKKNKSWAGNALIHPSTTIYVKGEPITPFADWTYYYASVHAPETIHGIKYDSIVHVQEVDDSSSLIAYRYSVAKYALRIGLVFREVWILDSQNTDVKIPWKDRGEQGYILRQTLVDHN